MNIIETLKNVDFENQYVVITFSDNSNFSTKNHYTYRKDRVLKPILTTNEDGSFTITEGNNICCFKSCSVIALKINDITYTEDVDPVVEKALKNLLSE